MDFNIDTYNLDRERLPSNSSINHIRVTTEDTEKQEQKNYFQSKQNTKVNFFSKRELKSDINFRRKKEQIQKQNVVIDEIKITDSSEQKVLTDKKPIWKYSDLKFTDMNKNVFDYKYELNN